VDDSLPNTKAYLQHILSRLAYQKAMAIAGPGASKR
jgi:hypothetical protein